MAREAVEPAPAFSRLCAALDVFLEPIETDVSVGIPAQKDFVSVLAERSRGFEPFIRPGADEARCRQILAMVSGSVGVSDIETEQCREQAYTIAYATLFSTTLYYTRRSSAASRHAV